MIQNLRMRNWNAIAITAILLLTLAFVFGGASRQNALRLAAVELAALPLLIAVHGRYFDAGLWKQHRLALGILGAVLLLPLVQIVPLPPEIWTSLPGRQQVALALDLAAIEGAWVPLSLSPDATWRSFLALLPPAAMLLGVLAGPPNLARGLVLLTLAFATASIGLGAIQVASGSQDIYPWATTAAGQMAGFFANRNHFATLLLLTLPLCAAFGGASLAAKDDRSRAIVWLSALYIGLVIIAVAVVRSRAGIVLIGPALAGSFMVAWVAAGRGRPRPALFGMAAIAAVALVGVCILGLNPILARFDSRLPTDARLENLPLIAEAAQSFLPVGSGIGSFDPVFRSVEPLERLDATYFNQAHNEYIQVALEAGWLGVIAIILTIVWWGLRARKAWKLPATPQADLQRAATVALALVAIHSAADYPLRTETIAVLFALCAAILERTTSSQPEAEAPRRRKRRIRA